MSETATVAGKHSAPAMVGDLQSPTKKMKTEKGEIPTASAAEGDGAKGVGEGEVEEEEEGENPYAHLGKVKEEDVGITEFISPNRGISAVIKQRYSDFIVNEVSNSGQIVHLTHLKAPVVKEPVEEAEPCAPVDDVITEDLLSQLKLVAAGTIPHTSVPAGEDKSWRLRLHRAVKLSFPTLETKTEEREGAKVITATLKGKGGKGRDNRGDKERFEWPLRHRDRKYCRFTMYKENKNTSDVVHLLAKFLKVKESLFGFAGTKDRRAKTTQELTAFKIHPTRLQNLNKFLRNVMLGNFSYADKSLKLGDLSGNHFTIVLRNVKGDDKDLEACLTSLKTVGFINYYGLQRFGAQNCATYEIGRAILKGSWEDAVNMILSGVTCSPTPPATNTSNTADNSSSDTTTPTTETTTDTAATNATGDAKMDTDATSTDTTNTNTDTDTKMDTDATASTTRGSAEGSGKFVRKDHSKVWRETRDPNLTLQTLRPFNHIERKLCHSLCKKPNDYLGALQSLYRNTRLLYPHSYQSYVWNTMASRRVKMFGLKPVVGDLVLPPGSSLPADEDPEDGVGGGKQEENRGKSRLQPVVLDETNVSQYSIYDVVLPLPGFDVIYPNNEVHAWYREMLEKDGLDIDGMRRKQKDFSLPGSYRYVVMQPRDMSWEILKYDNVKEALALSDADILNGMDKPQSLPEGKQKAVCVSFTLGLSAYATMALREVLKQDTSAAHQASLNDA